MSVRTALGASHETHGSRKNVPGEISWVLIALRICCWCWTRVRSFSAGLHAVLARAGERSAWVPLRWWVPGRRFSVKPPFLTPPLISEQTRPVLTSTPPIASMNSGKFGEVDDDQVVDLDAGGTARPS